MHRVLLVDDEKYDLEGIYRNVSWIEYGMEICAMASNGKQGLELAKNLHPDIIITDVSMPFMNGLDMVREYRKIDPNVITVFMTCFEEFEFAQKAISLSAAAYVLKPINLEEFSEVLQTISEQKTKELNERIQRQYLERTVTKSKTLLCDEFYRDLLLGLVESMEEFRERADFLGLNKMANRFACMYLQIDNFKTLYGANSARDRFFLIEMILYTIRELLDNSNEYGTVKVDGQNVAFVRFFEESAEPYSYEDMILLANYVKEQLNIMFNIGVTICISEEVVDLKELSKQYGIIRDAIDSHYYAIGNCILTANEFIGDMNTLNYDYQKIKEIVLMAVTEKDEVALCCLLDQYYSKNTRYSREDLKTLAYTIVSFLQSCILDNDAGNDEVFKETMIAQERLVLSNTIQSIREEIEQLVRKVTKCVHSVTRTRGSIIAEDIEGYVKQNYKSITSVVEIAEHLGLSTSYANTVYKQQKGKTVFEFLVTTKLEAACNLLKKPYCRVNEVAAELGYTSSAYFSNVFKQRYHMTPREYREKYVSPDNR